MRGWLEEVWYGSAHAWFLRPMSALYAGAQGLRSAAYRSGLLKPTRVGRPVVVVGNLTVGGTGKTPLVAWLVEALAARGIRAGIVSRGYGRSGDAVRSVDPRDSWRDVGDEPLLLARRTRAPVVVGRDRVAAARRLIELGVDAIVADDGLQHLRLARDFELVVVDGARGFGNGRLLPSGPLREPLTRLRTVDAVVVNGDAPAGRPLAPASSPALRATMRVVVDGVLPVDSEAGTGPRRSNPGVAAASTRSRASAIRNDSSGCCAGTAWPSPSTPSPTITLSRARTSNSAMRCRSS